MLCKNGAEAFFAQAQGLLGFLAPGDVLHDGLEFGDAAAFVEEGAHGALLPDESALGQKQLVVERLHGLRRGQPGKMLQRDFAVLLGQGGEKIGADAVSSACWP